jgi:hypothetical protein
MDNDVKAVKWEKVYIFISSTFNDMHGERDYLVKRVFPQLAEWCGLPNGASGENCAWWTLTCDGA